MDAKKIYMTLRPRAHGIELYAMPAENDLGYESRVQTVKAFYEFLDALPYEVIRDIVRDSEFARLEQLARQIR